MAKIFVGGSGWAMVCRVGESAAGAPAEIPVASPMLQRRAAIPTRRDPSPSRLRPREGAIPDEGPGRRRDVATTGAVVIETRGRAAGIAVRERGGGFRFFAAEPPFYTLDERVFGHLRGLRSAVEEVAARDGGCVERQRLGGGSPASTFSKRLAMADHHRKAAPLHIEQATMAEAEHYRIKAQQVYRLARHINDPATVKRLEMLASEYESAAREHEQMAHALRRWR
jgi:hypothetical protein